jgi:hypothetical protein
MRRRFARSRSFAPQIAAPAPAPLPGAVVDAVLRFHDEVQDQGCGRSLLRLAQPEFRSSGTNAKARSSASWKPSLFLPPEYGTLAGPECFARELGQLRGA